MGSLLIPGLLCSLHSPCTVLQEGRMKSHSIYHSQWNSGLTCLSATIFVTSIYLRMFCLGILSICLFQIPKYCNFICFSRWFSINYLSAKIASVVLLYESALLIAYCFLPLIFSFIIPSNSFIVWVINLSMVSEILNIFVSILKVQWHIRIHTMAHTHTHIRIFFVCKDWNFAFILSVLLILCLKLLRTSPRSFPLLKFWFIHKVLQMLVNVSVICHYRYNMHAFWTLLQ